MRIQRLGLAAIALFFGSCQEETIRVHRVPKPVVPAQRTIAVMILRPDATWFLKMTGLKKAVDQAEDDFRKIVESASFKKEEMDWKTPENWKPNPPVDVELAAFQTPQQAKFSVSKLGRNQELFSNVNRWRDKIHLPPIGPADLPKFTKPVTVGGIEATWVDVVNPGNEDA